MAFDVSGLRDSIRHERTGWLADEKTFDQTLRYAFDILSEPGAAARIGSECRAWSTQLSWSATGDRFRGVLAGEEQRLRYGAEDRTARADIVAMVTLTEAAAKVFDTSKLRATDQANFCSACVDSEVVSPLRLLLPGADDSDASRVVHRASGGALTGVHGDGVTLGLARPMDLLTWNGFGDPHNFRRADTVLHCPHHTSPALDLEAPSAVIG